MQLWTYNEHDSLTSTYRISLACCQNQSVNQSNLHID